MAALPEGTLDYLLLPENIAELQSILTYHVLEGAVYGADAVAGEVIALNGEPLTVTIDEATGSVMINDANVIDGDIPASNGVIHVLDAVLFPPSVAVEEAATTTGATGAVETTGATGAVDTTVAAEATVPSASTTVAAETTEAGSLSTTFAVDEGEETTTVATTTAPEMTVSPTATPAEKSG